MTDGMATPSEALDEEGNTNDSVLAATSLLVVSRPISYNKYYIIFGLEKNIISFLVR
jgi:hypothetical protein